MARHYYALITESAMFDLYVGGMDGTPQNFWVSAYPTRAERDKAVHDAFHKDGGNGKPVTRKYTERWHGRDFWVCDTCHNIVSAHNGEECECDRTARWAREDAAWRQRDARYAAEDAAKTQQMACAAARD